MSDVLGSFIAATRLEGFDEPHFEQLEGFDEPHFEQLNSLRGVNAFANT